MGFANLISKGAAREEVLRENEMELAKCIGWDIRIEEDNKSALFWLSVFQICRLKVHISKEVSVGIRSGMWCVSTARLPSRGQQRRCNGSSTESR